MPGKRQLFIGGENTHAVIGLRRRRFEYKCRFRQICPARHGVHFIIRQPFGIKDHGQRIAFQWHSGKHINLFETTQAGHSKSFLDRKSTRLNSTHITISYAVSSLKKKKKNHNKSSTSKKKKNKTKQQKQNKKK